MIDINNTDSIEFGRRKSDIYQINAQSPINHITNKRALETFLRTKIIEFRQQLPAGKQGYRSLHEYIAEHFYTSLIASHMDEEKADALIAQCVPSHTSLRNFMNGENLGMKYLDCIAYVFDVKYVFSNFGLDTFVNHLQS